VLVRPGVLATPDRALSHRGESSRAADSALFELATDPGSGGQAGRLARNSLAFWARISEIAWTGDFVVESNGEDIETMMLAGRSNRSMNPVIDAVPPFVAEPQDSDYGLAMTATLVRPRAAP